VVEEAVIAGHAFGARALRRAFEEAKRHERALHGLIARDVAALDADAVGGEPETDRSNARERLRVRITIRNEAVVGIGGFPEIVERAPLDVVEQGRQRRTQQRRYRCARRLGCALSAAAVYEDAGGGDEGD